MSDARAPLLEASCLRKRFTQQRGAWSAPATVYAVEEASFRLRAGETLGIVGESGCGKSTLARMVIRLIEPDAGTIRLVGVEITHATQAELRPLRRRMQMVFQDPYGSLNPRMRAGDAIAEPLRVRGVLHGSAVEDRVADLFRRVGLRTDQRRNRPSQFSGGQRQRLAIARALALDPALNAADEPVSALDVSISGAGHEPPERHPGGTRPRLSLHFPRPQDRTRHQRSRRGHVPRSHRRDRDRGSALPGARPSLFADAARRYPATGSAPSPGVPARRGGAEPPPGCPFHPRCPRATGICRAEMAVMRILARGTEAACHHAV
jgi:ABC-type oligopeptide transport system ATPase subunit